MASDVGAGWSASSTKNTYIYPTLRNGVMPAVNVGGNSATSTGRIVLDPVNYTFSVGNTIPPQLNGFGTGYASIQTSTSSNDVEQWDITNRSSGTSAAACHFFDNDKTTGLGGIGVLTTYYGGVCFAGSNYNIPGFNALRPNGMALFATDGPLTIGSGSTNSASSSVYFQAGSGLDASYDMVLAGGTGNLGIGTTSPYAKLSVVGETVARNFTATSTTATSVFNGFISSGKWADTNMFYSNNGVLTATNKVQLTSGGNIFTVSANTLFSSGVDFQGATVSNITTAPGWLVQLPSGGLMSSTSPNVDWINATSTSRASTFPYASTTALTTSGTASTTDLVVSNTLSVGTTTPIARLNVRSNSVSQIPFATYGILNQTADILQAGVGSSSMFAINRNSASKTVLNLGSYNRPTGFNQISTDVDGVYAGGQELNIRVSTFGGGGRIRFGGVDTSGAETSAYSLNFAEILNFESTPYKVLQVVSTDVDFCPTKNCSVIGNDSDDYVMAYGGGALNYITNAQTGDKAPALRFKSYLSSLSAFAANTAGAYVFNTATSTKGLGTKAHTTWDANDVRLMTLSAAGNLGIGTSTINRPLVVTGDAYLATSTAKDSGIILKATDDTCHRLVVSSVNVVTATTVTCP